MGRMRLWTEDMGARFEEGTFRRMDKARKKDETRTDFVRTAVERELRRRQGLKVHSAVEREKARKKASRRKPA